MGSCRPTPPPTNDGRQISSNSDSTIYRGPKRRYSAANWPRTRVPGTDVRTPTAAANSLRRKSEGEGGREGRVAAPRPIFVNDRPIKYSTASSAGRRPKRHRCQRLRKRLTHLYVHRNLAILNNVAIRRWKLASSYSIARSYEGWVWNRTCSVIFNFEQPVFRDEREGNFTFIFSPVARLLKFNVGFT